MSIVQMNVRRELANISVLSQKEFLKMNKFGFQTMVRFADTSRTDFMKQRLNATLSRTEAAPASVVLI